MDVTSELEGFWREEETPRALRRWLEEALEEDRAGEDVTTLALFDDPSERARGRIVAREAGVLCGGPAALAVFELLARATSAPRRSPEGSGFAPGDEVLVVEAPVAAILGGERTALNILGHLSGIATAVARWRRASGSALLLDTRKTFPGARLFQKHAVRAGGGASHRFDLAELPLVKGNHRRLFETRRAASGPGGGAAAIPEMVRRLRAYRPGVPIEIEVEDLPSAIACVRAGVDRVLIDNQSPETVAAWIAEASRHGRCEWECSGGLREANVAAYAAAGAGRLSAGALTHSVQALDLSLDVEWAR